MEWHKQEFTISDDRRKLDIGWVAEALRQTYWASDRSNEVVAASCANSLCFGLYRGGEQIGFARLVTDEYTFAWLDDVLIDPAHRGSGLGTWLVKTALAHPLVKRVDVKLLGTRDAHSLYEKLGFSRDPGRYMAMRES